MTGTEMNMFNDLKRFGARALLVICALTLATIPAARALAMPNPHVQDNAGFFSRDAIKQADAKIAQIKTDYGKDCYIQTEPSIPDAKKAGYQPDQRAAFFKAWADEIGKSNQVDGVIVLICKDPSYLQVRSGKETIKQAFIGRNIDELSKLMLDKLKAKQPDDSLASGVQCVADTFAQSVPKRGTAQAAPAPAPSTPANTTADRPAPQPEQQPQPTVPAARSTTPGMGTWICLIAGIFIVFMLIRGIFAGRRSMMGGGPGFSAGMPGPGMPTGYGYGPGYGGAGGGGFGRGFLGGLLGGALGGYMYDRTRGGGSSQSAHSAGGIFTDNSSSGGGSFDSPASSDFGSGGGDYSGGGGDFGSGGGDAGGGGGGGDSGGSGGGDF